MTPIRRFTLTALAAMFIALGTIAPVAAADHPDTVCDYWYGGRWHCDYV